MSDFAVDELRDALVATAEGARARSDCPDPDVLWEAASGRLPRGELAAVLDHTAECGACVEAWRLAREVGAGSDARPSRRRLWFATGMVLAAAAAVLFYVKLRPQDSGEPAYRGNQKLASLVADDTSFPRDQVVLRWQSAGNDAVYDLLLSDETMAMLGSVPDLPKAHYHVPVAMLRGVSSGARVLWRVEARLADGTKLSSATFRIRVR